MKNMTLKEVCDKVGVSRRTVQGYEKVGLVKATGKLKQGYLFYDEEMVERIRMIRMYQNAGFQVKQIKEIIDEPAKVRKAALEDKILKLKQKSNDIAEIICQIERFIKTL